MNPNHAHAVILNPAANRGRSSVNWKNFLKSSIAERVGLNRAEVFNGQRYSDRTRRDQELDAWILEKAKKGCKNFVVAGGDGTVHFVLNHFINLRTFFPALQECRLGAVGLGISNNFHRPFTPSHYDSETGLYYRLDFASAFLHDVGKVDTPVTHYFVNHANLGVTAQARLFFNEDTTPWFKSLQRVSSEAASAFAAVREFYQFQSLPVRLTSDERASRAVELVSLGVIKNPYCSGRFLYDVSQRPNDGKLGVYICERMGKVQMLKTLFALSQGKFSGLPHTDTFLTKDLRIESCIPFALEMDGEVRRVRVVDFKILPENIYICP